jgi:hypothetical protein
MSDRGWLDTGTHEYPPHGAEYLRARAILHAAKVAGIAYVTATEARGLVGDPKRSKTPSDGLAIPFSSGGGGTVRFLAKGASPKMQCPRDTPNYFYEGAFRRDSDRQWPAVRHDKSVPLHIVEGPLKALACTWHGVPAIGVNGVYGWSSNHKPIDDFRRFVWKGRIVVLCFDSDIMQKWQVRQALRRLGDYLITLGAKVRIKLLPSTDGTNVGADDYIAKHGAKMFLALSVLPLSDPRFGDWGASEIVQELNRKLGFVMHDGRATVLSLSEDPDFPGTEKVSLSRVHDVELEYSNQFYEYKDSKGNICQKPKFPVWLHDPLRRKVRRLTLLPGAEPGFDSATGDYNLWQRWGVLPHKPDAEHRWAKLQAHLLEVVAAGNEIHAAYILDWLAFCVQKPDRRPEVALALLGGEGVGKGILLNAIVKLFGRHGMHLDSQHLLVGNFNDHLKDKIFIFADEAFFAGDKASLGKLKAMVTEPTRVIEPKFVNAYTLPNYSKIAIASNEKWVVPADTDSRRYAVFKVSEARHGDHAYFAAIANELENGGYEAMLYDLQHRNITRFDPRKYPSTPALFVQKKLSFDETTGWYFERLCLGRLRDDDIKWTRTIDRDEVQLTISERLASAHTKKSIETIIGVQLKRLCPKLKDSRVLIHGRRRRRYTFPSLRDSRLAFQEALHQDINWRTGEARTGERK